MTAAFLDPLARAIYAGALRDLDPAERVRRALASAPPAEARLTVIAAGKASAAMARGAASAVGERIRSGLVVAPEGEGGIPSGFSLERASHPVPDARSERAGRLALEAAAGADPRERLLSLISGGASALLCAPAPGLSREEKVGAVAAAMAAGAPIEALNALRKHLSALKGGRLAHASPAPVTTLVASDVVGDAVDAIGSGPTIPDPTHFEDAWRAAEESCGADAIPPGAREHLRAGLRGEREETPKRARPGDEVKVIAGVEALARSAACAARDRGTEAEVSSAAVRGDVVEAAEFLASELARARRRAAGAASIVCLAAAGEPTVALPPSPGTGGRAHQLALLVAQRIRGWPGVAALAAGSDGIDGKSHGAGAVVTGETWDAMARAGIDPGAALARFDAATALAAAGAQIAPGPTGINHADLFLALARP